jgi:hypothetical protein
MDLHTTFESRLEALDLGLFDAISSQSLDDDRKSWLAIQRSVRASDSGYVYLEIGSHLGGSLQQHVLDPKCRRIFSIDERPLEQSDNRGPMYKYPGNSTARMMQNLYSLAPESVEKVVWFDTNTRDLDCAAINEQPDFCFIDGEHTTAACIADFDFCFRVVNPKGVICFHDDWIVAPAIIRIIARLSDAHVRFVPLKLGGSTFAISLRDCPVGTDPIVRTMSSDARSWLRMCRLAEFSKHCLPKTAFPLIRSIARLVFGQYSN